MTKHDFFMSIPQETICTATLRFWRLTWETQSHAPCQHAPTCLGQNHSPSMRRPPGKVLSFAYDTKCGLNYISQQSLVPHLANVLCPLAVTCGSTRSFCRWIWKKWLCPTWSPTVPRSDLCLPGRAGPGTSLEVTEDHEIRLCTKLKRMSSWTEIFWLMQNPKFCLVLLFLQDVEGGSASTRI